MKNKYVKLMGGLGNQMFQYAFAKSLQSNLNCPVFLDLTFLNSNQKSTDQFTARDYELENLNIDLKITDSPSLAVINSKVKIIRKIAEKLWNPFIYREDCFGFNPEAYDKNKILFIGYFQSEKYFQSYRTDLLLDFSFKNISKKNLEIANELKKNKNSVSIHIRRGDYINNQAVTSFHGVCGLEYYVSAIEIMEQRLENPLYCFFSDDMEWVKNNFKSIRNCMFIDHNTGKNSFQDMYLMSKCNHNIIANSSFSWWGAWLNENSNKVVIAPQKWFASENINTCDLIPNSWIRV